MIQTWVNYNVESVGFGDNCTWQMKNNIMVYSKFYKAARRMEQLLSENGKMTGIAYFKGCSGTSYETFRLHTQMEM
jgi:hypothetical protein